jgi:hypothetical protein
VREDAPVHPLLDLPGLVESTLPEALLAQLPEATPPPPWDCRVRAVVWVQRAPSPLPASSHWANRALPVTLGAVVHYLDSPVGSYREVFAGPLLRGRGRLTVHVPFIAVDSLPSVHGGRAHWALPKALASFAGDVGEGGVSASGDGWSVQVRSGGGLPVPMLATFGSEGPLGRSDVVVRGRGRATRVHVRATGPTLTGWLGEGTHAGVVGSGRLVVRAPHPG